MYEYMVEAHMNRKNYKIDTKSLLDAWESKEYEQYARLLPYTTGYSLDEKSFEISDDEGKAYSVTPPRYGDAGELYETSQDLEAKLEIQNYINIMHQRQHKLYSTMETTVKLGPINRYKRVPVLYIEEQPKVTLLDTTLKPKKGQKAKAIKPKPKVYKEKASIGKEKALKQILSNSAGIELPFKTFNECVRRATKQKHYISKADLVKVIEKNPRLKAKVGDNVATQTKDQICTSLFKV